MTYTARRRMQSERAHPSSTRPWTLDGIVEELRAMREAAGHPSYAQISRRIAEQRAARGVPAHEQRPARATVYDCFRTERRRLDIDLVIEIVRALGADDAVAARWAQACRVAHGQADAATVVTAHADLPAQLEPFVGRDAELDLILRSLGEPELPNAFSIEGMPGSGKSQLAIKVAGALRDHGHVDGVLHADLRGFQPDNLPADPAAVLGAFLRLLDVPGREIPDGLVRRQEMYAAQLAARRHVIVLDDASNSAQVLPLLVPGHDSVVLITSRTALSFPAEVVQIPLGTFTHDEAIALLRDVAGAELVEADPTSATELVEASGCLPLAVGLTATRVATRSEWSLADHVEPLLRRRHNLRLDDAVGATLDVSYAALSSSAQSTLRLLGTHPCVDLDIAAITALVGGDVDHVQRDVNELETHHLVAQPRPHRYSLHALVQTFALDRSYDDDRPSIRDAALARLCDHHAAMVWAAHFVAHGSKGPVGRRAPEHLELPDIDENTALAWLDASIDNILTLASHGAEFGRPNLVTHLSDGTAGWLNRYGRYHEARMLHSLALDTASARGDQVSKARSHLDLGQMLVRLTRWDNATTHLNQAERMFDEMGDMYGTCAAVNALAIIDVHHGRLDEGIERFHRAARLSDILGNHRGAAGSWDNIAIIHRRAGRLTEALKYHSLALDRAEQTGDRYQHALTSSNISEVQFLLGSLTGALESARRAMAIGRELDSTPIIAYSNDNVGTYLSLRGDHDDAHSHHQEALKLSRRTGDRHLEAAVLNNLGINDLRMDKRVRARDHHDAAYEISSAVGDLLEQARALDGIGSTLAADADVGQAHEYWNKALGIFETLGAPEAAAVRDRIAGLTAPAEPS